MSKPPATANSNTLILRRQLAELTKRPVEGFSAGGRLCTFDHLRGSDPCLCQGLVDDDNLYEWEIMIIGFVSLVAINHTD